MFIIYLNAWNRTQKIKKLIIVSRHGPGKAILNFETFKSENV